ncbi:MAG: PIN domain-containing protein [Chloroflexi bacterium]|nr:PIN domain-containing protein [Chloroflexota bacterium]
MAIVPLEQQFTSAITLRELLYGAYRLGTQSGTLLERLEKTLLRNLPVIPFDAEAAYTYGETRGELERRGIVIGDADLRIAAIALARHLTVITGNVRRFQRVPDCRWKTGWISEIRTRSQAQFPAT